MAKFDVDDLFGVNIDFAYFNASEIVATFGLSKEVLQSKRVKGLIAQHGRKHRIVSIAIRQVMLSTLQPFLDEKFLPYDSSYVDDALHINPTERRYEAEEKLLYLALSLATGRSVVSLKRLGEKASTKETRAFYGRGRSLYQYLRQTLNDHTRDYIMRYKEGEAEKAGSMAERVPNDAPDKPSKPSNTSPKAGKFKKNSATQPAPVSFDKEVQTALSLQEQGNELIAEQARSAVSGSPMDSEALHSFNRKLIDSYLRNPNALLCVRHIQNSDDYIAQHSFGCAVLGCHLANVLQLDEKYVEVITLGALLFDVGRFKLPPPLTNKAGKLSEAEFALMRKHLQFGEGVLKQAPQLPKVVYQMLWEHHERIDGAGYPQGKVDKEISSYGRIGAIVDAYDSMTSEQTFKAAMMPTQALKRMRSESGLAFDEKILQLFLSSLGRVPVGSCVSLTNGRLAFVLTLNQQKFPSLVRQVYSLSSKSYIPPTDIFIDKTPDTRVDKVVAPADYGLRFVDHIS